MEVEMSKGKVAIYMCCYNHEKYVAEAIETIIGQTYTNWELWIANDGSEDSSGEIIASYTDERIHFYNFEKNTKLVGAQSYLLEKINASDCEYIVGTCSDDKWKCDRLEKQVKLMNEHPEYAACFSWDEFIFEKGTENDPYREYTEYSHQKNRSRYLWIFTFGMFENDMNSCSAMIRKEVYFKVGGFNQYFIRLGDYRLWGKIVLEHSIYVIQEPLVYYRRHATNISRVNNNTALGVINEMYIIKKSLFADITQDDFYRSFYKRLIYAPSNSDMSFLTDKMFLMLTAPAYAGVFNQIVMDIWLENSDDKEFTGELKNRYGFDNFLLERIHQSSGIGPTLLEALGYKKVYNLEPLNIIEIFISQIMSKAISEDTLNKFLWNPLYLLAFNIISNNLSGSVFNYLKEEIYKVRMDRINSLGRKAVHIIFSSEYKKLVEELLDDLAADFTVYISCVYKNDDYFDNSYVNYQENSWVAYKDVTYIDMYDKENKCLSFDMELKNNCNIIWYIGCLGDGYECNDMLRGYSLEVSQMAMIDKNSFTNLNELKTIEMLLDSIDYL